MQHKPRTPEGLVLDSMHVKIYGPWELVMMDDIIHFIREHTDRAYCGHYLPGKYRVDVTEDGTITCLRCLNLILKRPLRLQ